MNFLISTNISTDQLNASVYRNLRKACLDSVMLYIYCITVRERSKLMDTKTSNSAITIPSFLTFSY